MGAGETNYEEIISPEDYENINPYTQQIMSSLIPQLQGAFQGGMGAGGGDFMSQFMAAVPGLQGITSSALAPFEASGQRYVESLIDPMTSQVGNILGSMNAQHSSAFPKMFMEGMQPAIQQMANQRAQLGAGMFGNLAQTAMPLFQQGNLQRMGMGMQAAGMLGGIGDPNYVGPEMAAEYTPGFLDYLGPVLGGAGDFMSAFNLGED